MFEPMYRSPVVNVVLRSVTSYTTSGVDSNITTVTLGHGMPYRGHHELTKAM